MLSLSGRLFYSILALNPHAHFSFKGNDNLNLITQTAVRHCQHSKIMNTRFIYLIEYDVAQYSLIQERSRNLLTEILLIEITREQTVGTMIDMQIHLTLTMRHPSWIFLFFGGRIVTFAPV